MAVKIAIILLLLQRRNPFVHLLFIYFYFHFFYTFWIYKSKKYSIKTIGKTSGGTHNHRAVVLAVTEAHRHSGEETTYKTMHTRGAVRTHRSMSLSTTWSDLTLWPLRYHNTAFNFFVSNCILPQNFFFHD